MNTLILSVVIFFVIILCIAVIKSRRANPEQSATEMHPDNFKKPKVEKVKKPK